MKFLFYSSHKIHAIVGEAIIEEFEILPRDKVLIKYKEMLFLTPKEFEEYSTTGERLKRTSRSFLMCVLKDIILYKKPVTSKRSITPVGEYLTKKNYEWILSKSEGTIW